MNCKPGDLAVYVGREIDARGKIVRVVRLEFANATGHLGGSGAAWFVKPPLLHTGKEWHMVMDKALRPIRDNPGADETLSWKDVPAPCKTKETEEI